MPANFKLTQRFPASVEAVLAARERRFDDVSKQEALKKQEILDRRHEGSVIMTRRAFSLADKIPEPIRGMVPAGFLQLVETARFDTATNTNRFEVLHEQNPGRLKIQGITHYIHESEQSSRREYDITVTVNIALLGSFLEQQIAASFRKGIEKDHEIIQEILAQSR